MNATVAIVGSVNMLMVLEGNGAVQAASTTPMEMVNNAVVMDQWSLVYEDRHVGGTQGAIENMVRESLS
jgi:hypothetical protein